MAHGVVYGTQPTREQTSKRTKRKPIIKKDLVSQVTKKNNPNGIRRRWKRNPER